jgi:hypothetical protein
MVAWRSFPSLLEDVKPLNIVRIGERWLLIDLDAAARIHDDRVGAKYSTAYNAPELVRPLCAEASRQVFICLYPILLATKNVISLANI